MLFARSASAGTGMSDHTGYLIDLDGTLIRQELPMAGAKRLLEILADRYVIVSNNSTDTATSLASSLRAMGLNVSPDQLVLAGELTVRWVAQRHPGARVLMAASETLQTYAQEQALRLVQQDPEFVILARDTRFDYQTLKRLANALRQGGTWLLSNPDLTHPADGRGGIVPETGALAQAISACSGRQPDRIFGKPHADILLEGLRRLGNAARRVAVVGDNPLTDGQGAAALGLDFIWMGAATDAQYAQPEDLLNALTTHPVKNNHNVKSA